MSTGKPRDAQHQRILEIQALQHFYTSGGIVTLEKKADIERRLKCLAENLKNMAALGFKTDFYPGTVTVFSSNLEESDFFSVQKVIS